MYACRAKLFRFPSPGEVRRRDPSSEKRKERGHQSSVRECVYIRELLVINQSSCQARADSSSLSIRGSVRSRDDEGDGNDDDDDNDGDGDDDGDDSASAGAT